MLKEKLYYLFKNSTFRNNFIELCIKQFISAFLGFILALFLTNMLAFAIAVVIFIIIIFITSAILSSKQHQFDLLGILKEEQKKSNWMEIIRLGFPLSRPLWLGGRYNLRVEIGEIVKTAAAHLDGDIKIGNDTYNSKYILASVLIDDLGWTRFVLGQSQKATNNINEGIRIAINNELWELAIKGNRHLIGILSQEKNFEKAEEIFATIEDLLKHLDTKNQLKIRAGLLFSKAECLSCKQNYNGAIEYLQQAQKMYLDLEDYERYVKIFDVLAEILIAQGPNSYNQAEITINTGLEVAYRWQRRERYIKLIILYIRLKSQMIISDECYTKEEYFNDKEIIDDLFKRAKDACENIQNDMFVFELKKAYKYFNKVANKYKNKKNFRRIV